MIVDYANSPRCECGHRAYDHIGRGRCNDAQKRCGCPIFREQKEDK